jgi:hypothetical protein
VLAESDEVVDTLYREVEQLALEQLLEGGITGPGRPPFPGHGACGCSPSSSATATWPSTWPVAPLRGLGGELSAAEPGPGRAHGRGGVHMWRDTADAYAERQPWWPPRCEDSLDDEMDDLHVSLTVEVVAGTMPLPVAVELAMVARFYERFGDHAVNLAKRLAAVWSPRPDRSSDRPPGRRAIQAAPTEAVRPTPRGQEVPRRSARR